MVLVKIASITQWMELGSVESVLEKEQHMRSSETRRQIHAWGTGKKNPKKPIWDA